MAVKPRMVKCLMTGEYGMSNEFYKAPNNKYFKSEDTYKKWLEKRNKPKNQKEGRTKESYDKIKFMIADLLGYKKGQPFPTSAMKKLKELDYYSDEVIIETIEKVSNQIKWAFEHKNFNGSCADYNKCSYMMAVITNSIASIQKEHDRRVENVKSKQIYSEAPDYEIKTNCQNNKDLSSMLGEDLWS